MNSFFKKYHFVAEVLIIFFLCLTPIVWLFDGKTVFGHDAGFRLHPWEHLQNLYYSWDSSSNFGADWSLFKGFLITQFPEAFFTTVSKSFFYGQVATLVFWFFAMALSMYIVVHYFFRERKDWFIRMYCSLFYVFNFFILQAWFIVERAKFSLFVALPLGFLILYLILSKQMKLMRGVALFSLLFFIFNLGGNPTLYGAVILVYGITVLFFAVFEYYKRNYSYLFFISKVVLCISTGFILINAYWILPQIQSVLHNYSSSLSSTGGIDGILAWERVVNKNASFINLFRLEGIPDWYENQSHPYSSVFLKNPLLVVASFVPLLVICMGLFLFLSNKKLENKKVIFLLLCIFILGLLFVAGSHPPFGFVYTSFIQFVPGFAIFRSAFYKFGVIHWFSVAFLSGYFFNLLIETYVKKKGLRFILSVSIIFSLLVYHFPFFVTNFFLWNAPYSTKVKIPQYVFEMSDYINTEVSSSSRVLLLPELDPIYHVDVYDWGFWSLDMLPRLVTSKSIIADTINSPQITTELYAAIKANDEKNFNLLVQISGANRILWRDDVLYSDKVSSSKSLQYEENNLKSFSSVTLEKTFGSWKLYSVNIPYSPVYPSANLEILSSQNPSIKNVLSSSILSQSSLVQDKLLLSGVAADTVRKVLFEADCILCEPNEFTHMKEAIGLPHVRYLPNSKFYFLTAWKEQQNANKFRDNPAEMISLQLNASNKRLVEFSEVLIRLSSLGNNVPNMDKIVTSYMQSVDAVLVQIDKLPQDKKNENLIKVLAYLETQSQFAESFRSDDQSIVSHVYRLQKYINERIQTIRSGIWMTETEDEKKYVITIDTAGVYTFSVDGALSEKDKFFLNEKEIIPGEILHLLPGIYHIHLTTSGIRNYVMDDKNAKRNGELITLRQDENILFNIGLTGQEKEYEVLFDYRLEEGLSPAVELIQGHKENNKYELTGQSGVRLHNDGKWHSYSYTFLAEKTKKNAFLQFRNCCRNAENTVFTIKNLRVILPSTPRVFLIKEDVAKKGTLPALDVVNKNKTSYMITVKNATSPFILNFADSFDKGWVAKYDNGEVIDSHIKVNGFANAWALTKEGTYTILLEYSPQRVVTIGVILSLTTLIGALVIVILKKR